MAEYTFSEDEVEALAAKLGELDDHFTAYERALLRGLLQRGIAAVWEEAGEDVQGFLLLPAVQAAREAARRSPGGPGGFQVELPAPSAKGGNDVAMEELTLNFTKFPTR